MMAEALVSCPANSRFRLVSCTPKTTLSIVAENSNSFKKNHWHHAFVQAGQDEAKFHGKHKDNKVGFDP